MLASRSVFPMDALQLGSEGNRDKFGEVYVGIRCYWHSFLGVAIDIVAGRAVGAQG